MRKFMIPQILWVNLWFHIFWNIRFVVSQFLNNSLVEVSFSQFHFQNLTLTCYLTRVKSTHSTPQMKQIIENCLCAWWRVEFWSSEKNVIPPSHRHVEGRGCCGNWHVGNLGPSHSKKSNRNFLLSLWREENNQTEYPYVKLQIQSDQVKKIALPARHRQGVGTCCVVWWDRNLEMIKKVRFGARPRNWRQSCNLIESFTYVISMLHCQL